MKKSREINKLAKALSSAQAEMPAAKKASVNPFFKSKYADLASVMEAAVPVLTKHGLSLSQMIDEEGLTTILMHTSGQFLAATMPLYLKDQTPQSQGSATTYARRYSYMAAIGMVADEDDDGNAASKTSASPVAAYGEPSNPTGLLSDKQFKMIAALMGKSKYGSLAAYEEQTKMDVSKLNRRNASALIAKLKDAESQANVANDEEPF